MNKVPGWKSALAAAVAKMVSPFGDADQATQQNRPVLTQEPSHIERVQPRTTRSDTDTTDTTRSDTTRSDTTASYKDVSEYVQNLTNNPRKPVADSAKADLPTDTAETTSVPDTVFVDGNTYSERGNPNIKTIENIEDGTATLHITHPGTDSTVADNFPADIDDNISLSSPQGRQALKNAGWTPTTTQQSNVASPDAASDDASKEYHGTTTTFTKDDATSLGLQPSSTLRASFPYEFTTIDDDEGELKAVKATDETGASRTYALGSIKDIGITRSERTTNTEAVTPEDITQALWGAVDNLDEADQSRLEKSIGEWVVDQSAYYDEDHSAIDEDRVQIEYLDSGHIERIALDADNPVSFAENHDGIAVGDSTSGDGGLYARPLLGMSSSQDGEHGGRLGENNEPIFIPTHNTDIVKKAVAADTEKSKIVANPEYNVSLIQGDDVNVSGGAEYSTTQGPGVSAAVSVNGWRAGIEANYALNTETTTTEQGIEGPFERPFPIEGTDDTIPAGGYSQNIVEEGIDADKVSLTAYGGRDTDWGFWQVGAGPTMYSAKTVETVTADADKDDLGLGANYQQTIREDPTSQVGVNFGAKVGVEPFDNGLQVTLGGDYNTIDNEFGGSIGITYEGDL